eukprot:9091108-Karenia_brevis.AAC.1
MRSQFAKLQSSQSKEDPLSFVIGNLGLDTEAETIESRAFEVLQAIGVNMDMVLSLACRGVKGSLVELTLADGVNWTRVKLAIRQLRKSYIADKIVWFDKAKSKEALKSGR